MVERDRRVWRWVKSLPRARLYAVLGALLALAAPLGLLDVRSPYVRLAGMMVLAALGHLVGSRFDRTRLLANTDSLTGLHNRHHFTGRLADEVARRHHQGGAPCLLCIDVDQLKAINDSLGNAAGDRVLIAVAQTLSKSVRAIDTTARIGGDEFAVLLPETTTTQASALAERLLVAVSRLGAVTGRVAVSIGIAQSRAANAAQLLAAAEAALQRAKAAGGGRAATHPGQNKVSASSEAPLVTQSE